MPAFSRPTVHFNWFIIIWPQLLQERSTSAKNFDCHGLLVVFFQHHVDISGTISSKIILREWGSGSNKSMQYFCLDLTGRPICTFLPSNRFALYGLLFYTMRCKTCATPNCWSRLVLDISARTTQNIGCQLHTCFPYLISISSFLVFRMLLHVAESSRDQLKFSVKLSHASLSPTASKICFSAQKYFCT